MTRKNECKMFTVLINDDSEIFICEATSQGYQQLEKGEDNAFWREWQAVESVEEAVSLLFAEPTKSGKD